MLALFVEQPTPFLPEFLEKVSLLDYPRPKIDLLVHSASDFHDEDLEEFFEKTNSENEVERWNSVVYLKAEDKVSERVARDRGIKRSD